MKKHFLFLILLILFSSIEVSAQTQISLNYNSVASGKNIVVNCSKLTSEEDEFGIGLKYNVNNLKHPDDQFNIFYRRMYATKFLQHFGVEAFYHKRILKNWKTVKPFVFYDLQTSYSTTRGLYYYPYAEDENGNVLYRQNTEFLGPYLWVEQNIGLGYNADLSNNFFITSKLGFEVMLVIGEHNEGVMIDEEVVREFGYQFSFGVGYRFNN